MKTLLLIGTLGVLSSALPSDFGAPNSYCGHGARSASDAPSNITTPAAYPVFASSLACALTVPDAHWNVDGSLSDAASTTHVIIVPLMLTWMGVTVACPPVRRGLLSTSTPALSSGRARARLL